MTSVFDASSFFITKSSGNFNTYLHQGDYDTLREKYLFLQRWAVENGFLTPTLKIKRTVVEGTYGPHFADWVERRETVLWHE